MTPLQEELIARVTASGRTQAELARTSGLSTKHVNQMLKGRVPGALDAWDSLLWATRQPAERKYVCSACRKIYRRSSEKVWIRSYCESSGRFARLMLKEDG